MGAASTPRYPSIRPSNLCNLRGCGPYTAGGFSLLELVMVIMLVIILFTFAFNRLLPLRGDAEASHVTSIIGSLRSAVALAAAGKVTRGGLDALDELVGVNPMSLLSERPENYLGEDVVASPGNWYFDTSSGELRYRVRFPEYLAGAPQGPVELAWRVEMLGAGQARRGVHLTALDMHRWPGHSRALRELTDAGS